MKPYYINLGPRPLFVAFIIALFIASCAIHAFPQTGWVDDPIQIDIDKYGRLWDLHNAYRESDDSVNNSNHVLLRCKPRTIVVGQMVMAVPLFDIYGTEYWMEVDGMYEDDISDAEMLMIGHPWPQYSDPFTMVQPIIIGDSLDIYMATSETYQGTFYIKWPTVDQGWLYTTDKILCRREKYENGLYMYVPTTETIREAADKVGPTIVILSPVNKRQ